MRICTAIAAIVVLLLAQSAAAEIYRWVDENGVVHYTDKPPRPGAEPARLPAIQTVAPRQLAAPPQGTDERDTQPAAPDYRVAISRPAPDEVIRDPSPSMTAAASVTPPLQPGHGLNFYFDGTLVNPAPTQASTVSLPPVYRGTHTLSVDVVDAGGRVLASSNQVSFHKLPPIVKRRH